MKKLISFVLALCLFSNIAFADSCDWSTIKKLPDGGFEYSAQLNLCVGALVQQAPTQTQQLSDLTQALSLKNAALLTSDQRTEMWIKNAQDSQDRLSKISADQKTNEWLFFGLGVATTFLAGYMASRLLHP